MSNLTIKTINAAKQPGKLMDGDGLHLTVGQNQSKRWVHRFMFQGKRRDMGLGVYPDVSLIDARELASEARRLMREGKDPIDERKAAKSAIKRETFKGAAEAAYESIKAGFSNAKHSAQWIQTIRTYALPKLGDKKVEELRASDFADMLRPIWMEKPETASRIKQRCD